MENRKKESLCAQTNFHSLLHPPLLFFFLPPPEKMAEQQQQPRQQQQAPASSRKRTAPDADVPKKKEPHLKRSRSEILAAVGLTDDAYIKLQRELDDAVDFQLIPPHQDVIFREVAKQCDLQTLRALYAVNRRSARVLDHTRASTTWERAVRAAAAALEPTTAKSARLINLNCSLSTRFYITALPIVTRLNDHLVGSMEIMRLFHDYVVPRLAARARMLVDIGGASVEKTVEVRCTLQEILTRLMRVYMDRANTPGNDVTDNGTQRLCSILAGSVALQHTNGRALIGEQQRVAFHKEIITQRTRLHIQANCNFIKDDHAAFVALQSIVLAGPEPLLCMPCNEVVAARGTAGDITWVIAEFATENNLTPYIDLPIEFQRVCIDALLAQAVRTSLAAAVQRYVFATTFLGTPYDRFLALVNCVEFRPVDAGELLDAIKKTLAFDSVRGGNVHFCDLLGRAVGALRLNKAPGARREEAVIRAFACIAGSTETPIVRSHSNADVGRAGQCESPSHVKDHYHYRRNSDFLRHPLEPLELSRVMDGVLCGAASIDGGIGLAGLESHWGVRPLDGIIVDNSHRGLALGLVGNQMEMILHPENQTDVTQRAVLFHTTSKTKVSRVQSEGACMTQEVFDELTASIVDGFLQPRIFDDDGDLERAGRAISIMGIAGRFEITVRRVDVHEFEIDALEIAMRAAVAFGIQRQWFNTEKFFSELAGARLPSGIANHLVLSAHSLLHHDHSAEAMLALGTSLYLGAAAIQNDVCDPVRTGIENVIWGVVTRDDFEVGLWQREAVECALRRVKICAEPAEQNIPDCELLNFWDIEGAPMKCSHDTTACRAVHALIGICDFPQPPCSMKPNEHVLGAVQTTLISIIGSSILTTDLDFDFWGRGCPDYHPWFVDRDVHTTFRLPAEGITAVHRLVHGNGKPALTKNLCNTGRVFIALFDSLKRCSLKENWCVNGPLGDVSQVHAFFVRAATASIERSLCKWYPDSTIPGLRNQFMKKIMVFVSILEDAIQRADSEIADAERYEWRRLVQLFVHHLQCIRTTLHKQAPLTFAGTQFAACLRAHPTRSFDGFSSLLEFVESEEVSFSGPVGCTWDVHEKLLLALGFDLKPSFRAPMATEHKGFFMAENSLWVSVSVALGLKQVKITKVCGAARSYVHEIDSVIEEATRRGLVDV